jgi:hypothetical protein
MTVWYGLMIHSGITFTPPYLSFTSTVTSVSVFIDVNLDSTTGTTMISYWNGGIDQLLYEQPTYEVIPFIDYGKTLNISGYPTYVLNEDEATKLRLTPDLLLGGDEITVTAVNRLNPFSFRYVHFHSLGT